MSSSQGNTKPPDYAKLYKEGIKTNLEFLPKQLAAELGYRNQYDPLFIQQALGLQHQFDPALAKEQFDALQRRDPQWLALHQGLGDKIKEALDRGYVDPLQNAAYQKWGALAGQVDPAYAAMYAGMAGQAGKVDPRYEALYNKITGMAGKVDPRYEAAYGKLAGLAGQIDPLQAAAYAKAGALAGVSDPTRAAEYKALGKQVTGDTLKGSTASPAMLRDMTQAILSRSPSLSYGEAQNMAAAVYTGQRGQALQQQRQAAGEQFLGQQSTTQQQQQSANAFYAMPSLMQQRQQSLGQFTSVLDPTRMAQQSLGAAGQFIDPTRLSQQSYLSGLSAIDPTRMSQASYGQFYGAAPPEMNAYGLAGTFIQPSNSLVGAENMIGGVQAPRSLGYVNPNAPSQALQFGLQNYPNMVANQQSSNPWMNALQGSATGAQYGSIGGGYGTAGGAIVGGVAGALGYPQYSDIRTKRDIVKIGKHKGLDVIEFRYWKGRTRFRGLIAQQVQEKFPDAVGFRDGFLTVDYDKIGFPMLKLCSHCKQFKLLSVFRATDNKIDGRRNECRACGKVYKKRWEKENRDKYLIACQRTSSRTWSKVMADPVRHAKMRATQNRLRATPKWRAKINAMRKRKWWENINFRLRMCLSHRVGNAIRRQKATKPTVSLLGCSLDEFKRHIQKQFREGMAWNNYGKWHIDHIRPCMSFDLLDPEQQKECFHFTNMQPLWATENLVKGNKQRSLSRLGDLRCQ